MAMVMLDIADVGLIGTAPSRRGLRSMALRYTIG